MLNFSDLINEYLLIEHTSTSQLLYCLITKVDKNRIYLIVSRDFEKSGLLVDDIIKCRVDRKQTEYYFDARILGMDIRPSGLSLIIEIASEVEEYYNVRKERRINLRLIAFTDNKNLASVVNVSKSGILLASKTTYEKGKTLDVKLVLTYPSTVCVFTGEVARVRKLGADKSEYGIKIVRFMSEQDAKKYMSFVDELVNSYENRDKNK